MSRQLAYSIVADGESDRALTPIIRWAIHRLDPVVEILEPEFRRRRGPVPAFLSTYTSGSSLVFVHRDSEAESLESRLREFAGVDRADVVPVIPVRMTEAWLLVDPQAIANAADAPDAAVRLPPIAQLERLTDPKSTLNDLLLSAAGPLSGRRLKVFRSSLSTRRADVATWITDFQQLEQLAAFQAFQEASDLR